MANGKLEQRRKSIGNVQKKVKISKNKINKTAMALGVCLKAFVRPTAFQSKKLANGLKS